MNGISPPPFPDRDRVLLLTAENARLREELERARHRYDEVVGSRSWRFTAPMRLLRDGLRSFVDDWRYRRHLTQVPILAQAFDASPLTLTLPTTLFPCNPSIVAMPSGWLVTVRTHNYALDARGEHPTLTEPSLRNENWIVTLDDDLNVTSREPIDDSAALRADGPACNGLEDYRISLIDGEIAVIASGSDTLNKRDTICTARLHGNRLIDANFLPSPNGQPREKNWMPVTLNGVPHAVHRVSPFRLVRLAATTEMVAEHEGPAELRGYSGSSQLVPFGNGWLCAIHRRNQQPFGLFYTHRLIVFERSWQVSAQSAEFFIERKGVEFCAGLACKGNDFILSYGVNDGAAKLMRIKRAQIEALLDPT